MTTTATTANTRPAADSGRWLIWTAGLIVALGAAVATAHGLYRVALAATVPPPIAWLYPLITDGLALVAYAATTRLAAGGRRYAWAVVVLAAGLSGLAQASYLAIGVHTVPTQLRFGVGAWPAVAAAITAHLLYLLAARPGNVRSDGSRADALRPESVRPYDAVRPVQPTAVRAAVVRGQTVRPAPAVRSAPASEGAGVEQLSAAVPAAGSGSADDDSRSLDGRISRAAGPDSPGLPPARSPYDAVRPVTVRPDAVRPVRPDEAEPSPVVRPEKPDRRTTVPVDTSVRPAVRQPVRPERPPAPSPPDSAGDRARAAALIYRVERGVLPTVSELMELADVGRGTAGLALKQLRDQADGKRHGLQVVHGVDAETSR